MLVDDPVHLSLHVLDALVLLAAGHTLHVDLLVVAAPAPRTHVSRPDPRVFQTLSDIRSGPGLDSPSVAR